MQWSFFPGEHEHLSSGPIDVLYLLSSLSLKVKQRGPLWSTRKRVILEATSNVCIIWVGILGRYGCDLDINIINNLAVAAL